MRRREFITFVGTLGGTVALAFVARALESQRRYRIGVLWPGTTPPMPPRLESFRQGLRDAGMIEGRDYQFEVRYARNGLQQLSDLASELVRMKVDVIQPAGDNAIRIAQQATTTIPIVATSDDMLGMGLISSLSRPGRNTAGLTILSPELNAKRLQLLKDLNPAISRVASIWDPTTGGSQATQTKTAATSLQIKLQVLEVRSSKDLVAVFEEAKREQVEALNVFSSPFLASIYLKGTSNNSVFVA
jgi:putative ABC transport system substrate-binding protein